MVSLSLAEISIENLVIECYFAAYEIVDAIEWQERRIA